MLPPKLMHILGGLAFPEFFFVKKSDPTMVKSHFKNTMGNPFLTFLNTDQNAPKKNYHRNMDILISNLV